jgi:hypothetical protein
MIKHSVFFLPFAIFISLNSLAIADDLGGYIPGIVANYTKSYSVEAIDTLNSFKSALQGCLVAHEGKESSCADLLPSSADFTYEFLQPPTDGSQLWSLQASGKGGDVTSQEKVTFTSDEKGNITCHSAGKLSGVCP